MKTTAIRLFPAPIRPYVMGLFHAICVSILMQAPLAAQAPPPDTPEIAIEQANTSIQLSLPARWNSFLGSGIDSMKELLSILSPFSRPESSLDINEFPEIKNGVTLMMPLKEALDKLRIKQLLPARQAIAFPGIPFYYRIFTNPAADGFNLVYIITDGADRVVALQYVNETPRDGNWYTAGNEHLPQNLLTYNFINSRKRATRTLEVRPGVRTRTDVPALPLETLLIQKEGRTRRQDEYTTRRELNRESSIQKTDTLIASVKDRIKIAETQLEQLKKTREELQQSNEAHELALANNSRDIQNRETLISNWKDQLQRLEKRRDDITKTVTSTRDPIETGEDVQDILCIQTILFDQKRFRTLEVVNWYVPRRIADFIHYNLDTQLRSAPKDRSSNPL